MQALNASVADLVALITAIIALYFLVGLVVNLAQAQLSVGTGDTMGHARALQQAIAMVILLAIAASARSLIPALQSYLQPGGNPPSTGDIIRIWKGIAQFVVTVVIGGVGIFTTVGAVYAGLGAQANMALGVPGGAARSMSRFLVLVGGMILTVSSIVTTNWLIGELF